MKKIIIISVSLILVTILGVIGYNKYQEQVKIDEFNNKLEYFQNRVKEINETVPEDLITLFLQHVGTDELYKNWDTDMINHQISYFYESEGNDNIKLCVEIIKYKVSKFKEDEPIEPQIQEYIDKIMFGKKDQIDMILINTFETSVKCFQKKYEYEPNDSYLY